MKSAGAISPQFPHFFKIILQDTLGHGKLEIPKNYVRKHGRDLLNSSTVLLRLPDGAEWQMGLLKSDGRIWLQNGWQKFAQHYCLNYGTFLVFRYAGSCRFEVLMFDQSCTEMEYPCLNNAGGCGRTDGGSHEQAEDDDDDDDDDGGGGGGGGGGNDEEEEEEEDVSVQIIDLTSSDDHAGDETEYLCSRKHQMRHFTFKQKANALAKADGFTSTRPFFKILIYPSYISSKKSYMGIPVHFARTLSKIKDEYAYLRLASRRRWRVKYHRLRGTTFGAAFCNGWLEFARDSHLQVGDVCVFELVNPSKLTFEVTVYKD